MPIHRRGPGTDSRLAAAPLPWLVLLVLTGSACAGRGGAPASVPSPAPTQEAEEPAGSRFDRSVDALRQISLRKGRLGWGGLEVGMTFRQAELVLGKRLPAIGSATQDELCGYDHLETELMAQPLRLEFSTEAGASYLQAIWLPLESRSGPPGRDEIVAALHARFPKLDYIPSPHAPDLPEERNPKPLYRVPEGGGKIFVMPGGVYFGEVCVD